MKKTKFLSMCLAISLILTPLTTYSETSKSLFPITYTSDDGNYTASKLSHPTTDVMQPDGIVDYENGTADRGENYSWSAVGYGDYMYIGVLYGAITQTLQIIAAQNNIDYSIFKASVDVLFNGTLFMGDEENNPDKENRSMLLKINTKTGDVTVVTPPNGASYRAAIEYKDKLYFAASCSQPYLLEVDPLTDTTKKVYTSQKPTQPFISVGIRGLTVANDQLVASMIGDDGAYIVSSSNPSDGQDSFKVIATQQDLLDYPAYHYNDSIFGGAIWDIVEFNNKLYVTVVTGKAGDKQAFAMFCGEENLETGKWDFKLLIGDENDGAKYPYGLGAARSGAANLFVYDNHLYIGGYNDPMIALPSALNMDFKPIYSDLSSPVSLWRMDTSENIELVAGDSNELFPTVLGNETAGFGSNLNQYVWRMSEFDNKLYVGTFDIGSLAYPLMQFTNGDVLHMTPEEIKSQINYIKILLDLIKDNNTLNENNIDTEIEIDTNLETDTFIESEIDLEEDSIIEEDSISEKSAEEVYIDSIPEEVQENLKDSLSKLYYGLSELDSILDNAAYSETESYGLSDSLINIYQNLVNEYLKIRDFLPEYLVQSLDKILNQNSVDNLFYFLETCRYLSEGERGFDLLVSEDGINFNTITNNGFGDPYNHGCRIFATTNAGLTLGTANPFYGTQVWKISDNTRGDLLNSIITNNNVTYNKSSKSIKNKSVKFDVEFNGNTLKTLQIDYKTLKEGIDYTLTDNEIILSDNVLKNLDIKTYSLSFIFSAGERSNATLNVIDEADSEDEVKPPTTDNSTDTSTGGTKPGNGNSTINKLPQTGSVLSSSIILLISIILLLGGFILFKKNSKVRA